jgi:hypothetical protein
MGHTSEVDGAGNIWVKVGSPREFPFLFVAHVDTCHKMEGDVKTMAYTIGQDEFVGLANKEMGCLGADDGVGVYVNLRMMDAGVKGTYLFTRGEEKGLIGADYIADKMTDRLSQYLLSVEVDRQGTTEIITEQCTGMGASYKFARALSDQLGMGHKPSTLGMYTDNSVFNGYIPENVNIAAGYDRQHTPKERVNVSYVERLVECMLRVDWSALPVKRDTWDYGEVYHMNDERYYSEGYLSHGQQPSTHLSGLGTYGTALHHGQEGFRDKEVDKQLLEEYTWMHGDRVSHYLYSMGITASEINIYWESSNDIPF